jgi:hypothetical protein
VRIIGRFLIPAGAQALSDRPERNGIEPWSRKVRKSAAPSG